MLESWLGCVSGRPSGVSSGSQSLSCRRGEGEQFLAWRLALVLRALQMQHGMEKGGVGDCAWAGSQHQGASAGYTTGLTDLTPPYLPFQLFVVMHVCLICPEACHEKTHQNDL